jgi:hypothetical protein
MYGLATLAHALSVEHDLEVTLFPAEHKLIGLDRLEIHIGDDETLTFRLSEKAEQISVEINGENRDFNRQKGWLHVPLSTAEQQSSLEVSIHYAAVGAAPSAEYGQSRVRRQCQHNRKRKLSAGWIPLVSRVD